MEHTPLHRPIRTDRPKLSLDMSSTKEVLGGFMLGTERLWRPSLRDGPAPWCALPSAAATNLAEVLFGFRFKIGQVHIVGARGVDLKALKTYVGLKLGDDARVSLKHGLTVPEPSSRRWRDELIVCDLPSSFLIPTFVSFQTLFQGIRAMHR